MSSMFPVLLKNAARIRFSALQATKKYWRRATEWDWQKLPATETVFKCRDNAGKLSLWAVFTDAVLGGRSRCELAVTTEGNYLFRGTLHAFERRHNPDQLRYDPSDEKTSASTTMMVLPSFARTRLIYSIFYNDLSEMDGIRIRVRADGRSYQLQMKHNSFDTYSFHYAEFETLPGEWMTIELPWDKFKYNHKARSMGYSKPPLNDINAIGFGIEDYKLGDFWMEIDSVEAYNKRRETLSAAETDGSAQSQSSSTSPPEMETDWSRGTISKKE